MLPKVNPFFLPIAKEDVLVMLHTLEPNVLADYGVEHMKTGLLLYIHRLIVCLGYPQDVVPIETLMREWARNDLLIGEHEVGRVIARPFTGTASSFGRISHKRHDWSAAPPKNHLVKELQSKGHTTASIGKVADLFNGEGFDTVYPTNGNTDGIERILERLRAMEEEFIFINLIDTDQLYGHRLDPSGYAEALKEIDSAAQNNDDNWRRSSIITEIGMTHVYRVPITPGSLFLFLFTASKLPKNLGLRNGLIK